MHKPKSINELLKIGGIRLSALKERSEQRNRTLDHVRAAVPSVLAEFIVTAGFEDGRLTVGVTGANWAARLRYVTDTLQTEVGKRLGVTIERVRITVVPPQA